MTSAPKPNENEIKCKIIIMGDSGVGKTSLMYRFCNKLFDGNLPVTFGIDKLTRTIQLADQIVKMSVWDTAGQEKYLSITKGFLRNSHGVLFVYDVAQLTTLTTMEKWFKIVQEEAPPDIVKVLVGHKCDKSVRMISAEEGKMVADYYEMPFFEASSKCNINVDPIFHLLAQMIVNKYNINNLFIHDLDNIQLTDENETPSYCYNALYYLNPYNQCNR